MAVAFTQPFTFLPPSKVGPPSPLLADNIDPQTRDYADIFTGMDITDAAVVVAVTTTRGSGAAVRNDGLRVSIKKMTSDAPRILESNLRQSLVRLTRARDITILGVSIGEPDAYGKPSGSFNESTQSGQINLRYRNLRAFDARVKTVPLSPRSV